MCGGYFWSASAPLRCLPAIPCKLFYNSFLMGCQPESMLIRPAFPCLPPTKTFLSLTMDMGLCYRFLLLTCRIRSWHDTVLQRSSMALIPPLPLSSFLYVSWIQIPEITFSHFNTCPVRNLTLTIVFQISSIIEGSGICACSATPSCHTVPHFQHPYTNPSHCICS